MQKRLFRILELSLLVLGSVLIGIYVRSRVSTRLDSQEALREFAATERSLKNGSDTALGQSAPDFQLWSPNRIKAYRAVVQEASAEPLAVLIMTKIHLEVPVFDGTDDDTLDRGVGRIIGTSTFGEEGNIGIAGHRDGFFRGLKDIGPGDRIELVTHQGWQRFVVDRVKIVDPNDVSVLAPRETASITLVTCYPFYFVGHAPQRYIVEAKRVEIGPQAQALHDPVVH